MAGIEPARAESKSAVLPLDYIPIFDFDKYRYIRSNELLISIYERGHAELPCALFLHGVDNRIRTDGLQCHKLAL